MSVVNRYYIIAYNDGQVVFSFVVSDNVENAKKEYIKSVTKDFIHVNVCFVLTAKELVLYD